MGSVAKHDRERALKALASWCILQLKGAEPKEEDLEELGFGSAEAMKKQLENWDIPSWVTQGNYATERPKRRRRARRSTDARTELPDASEAIPLFAPVVDALDGYISDLTVLRETYADERFEAVERYEMSAITDPAKNTTTYGPATLPLGARQSPPHALVALISAYVVEGKPLEPLLEVLHPSAKNGKRHQLDEKVAQLKLMAVHVAKLVRGGIVRTGHHTEELEPREQAAVEYITSQLRAGTPEPKIDETLLNRGFGRQEIRRLKKFRIDYPGQ
jgi:hypothetical protein